METGRLLRLAAYAATVTLAAAVGTLVINLFAFPALNPGSSVAEGLSGTIAILAFSAIFVIPAAIFFFVLVALVMGLSRRYIWWTGALSGLIPAVLFAVVAALLDGTTTYVGDPEQLASAEGIRVTVLVLSVIWSGLAGAGLAQVFKLRGQRVSESGY